MVDSTLSVGHSRQEGTHRLRSFLIVFCGLLFSMTGTAHAHYVIPDVPHWNLYVAAGGAGLLCAEVAFVLALRRRGEVRGVERIWAMMPLTVFLFLCAATVLRPSSVITNIGPNAIAVNVTARQWYWGFEIPCVGVSCRHTVHVPVGRDIVLVFTSLDVLHSFVVPYLGIHQDIVPRTVSRLAFRATRCGRYTVYCTALCGATAPEMSGIIEVDPMSRYTVWVDKHHRKKLVPSR